jgi:signal transduction histidine kinase
MSDTGKISVELPKDNGRVLSMFRLQATLTVFIVVLLGALCGLMVVLVSRILDSEAIAIRSNLNWKVVHGVGELADRLDLAAAVGDRELLAKDAKDFVGDSDIAAIVVTDQTGQVLYRHGEVATELFVGPPSVAVPSTGALVAWQPLAIEGQEIGRIALVVSTARLEAGKVLRRTLLTIAGVGCLAAMVLGVLFVRFYVGPIARLAKETIDRLRDLAANLEDRVRRRTLQLESSMENLKKTQAELAKASRSAGMADVATSVLHNVGNVLNSANVSTTLVSDRLKKSKSLGLAKAMELIRAHDHDLGDFLTRDDKGKKLPAFLGLVSDALQEERTGMMGELDQLTRSLDHIRVIISMQQNYAKASGGHVEILELGALLDEALAFNQVSYEKHHVEIVRQYAPLGAGPIDRHKIFQIFMNLLSNARHAVKDLEQPLRQITVSLQAGAAGRVVIEVSDNGVGIDGEVMKRLFEHGFTTKKEGHGFGLHSSANAATELGGTLTCRSDGLGKGATFRLEIPFVPGERRESSAA